MGRPMAARRSVACRLMSMLSVHKIRLKSVLLGVRIFWTARGLKEMRQVQVAACSD